MWDCIRTLVISQVPTVQFQDRRSSHIVAKITCWVHIHLSFTFGFLFPISWTSDAGEMWYGLMMCFLVDKFFFQCQTLIFNYYLKEWWISFKLKVVRRWWNSLEVQLLNLNSTSQHSFWLALHGPVNKSMINTNLIHTWIGKFLFFWFKRAHSTYHQNKMGSKLILVIHIYHLLVVVYHLTLVLNVSSIYPSVIAQRKVSQDNNHNNLSIIIKHSKSYSYLLCYINYIMLLFSYFFFFFWIFNSTITNKKKGIKKARKAGVRTAQACYEAGVPIYSTGTDHSEWKAKKNPTFFF